MKIDNHRELWPCPVAASNCQRLFYLRLPYVRSAGGPPRQTVSRLRVPLITLPSDGSLRHSAPSLSATTAAGGKEEDGGVADSGPPGPIS